MQAQSTGAQLNVIITKPILNLLFPARTTYHQWVMFILRTRYNKLLIFFSKSHILYYLQYFYLTCKHCNYIIFQFCKEKKLI